MQSDGASAARQASLDGRAAVLVMIGVAAIAAAFAWWWNFNRGKQTLDLYGPSGAKLVRTAPKVEILASDNHDNIDISKAPGLINARASLLSDSSYEWPAETAASPDSSAPAIRFSDGDDSLIIVFDFKNHRLLVNCRAVRLKVKTAAGWQSYIQRQTQAAQK